MRLLRSISCRISGVRMSCIARSSFDPWITIELARDLWFFLTKSGVSVRVFCQSSTDHSMLNELSERVSVYLDALRRNAGLSLSFVTETRSSWVLANGSSLNIVEAGASEAAAQKKGRGETVHRIHTTEIAFWEYAGHTLNALLEAIGAPDTGTEIVHESTPNGAGSDDMGSAKEQSGGPYFHSLCMGARQGRGDYAFHFFSWLKEPEYARALDVGEVVVPETDRERAIAALGATPEQLKWYRAKVADKGQDDTDQEYASDPDTCFLVSGRQFFDKSQTGRLLVACIDPIATTEIRRPGAVGSLRVWYDAEPGRTYVVAGDTSEGTGGDRGVGQVWETGTGRHMATLWGQFKPAELARELAALGLRYGGAMVAVERNNHGHACIQELERVGIDADGNRKTKYGRLFVDHDRKIGWISHEVSRTAALSELDRVHRAGTWSTPDRELVGEMRTFVVNKRGKAEGAGGSHDDLVMTAAIAWSVMGNKRLQGYDIGESGSGW